MSAPRKYRAKKTILTDSTVEYVNFMRSYMENHIIDLGETIVSDAEDTINSLMESYTQSDDVDIWTPSYTTLTTHFSIPRPPRESKQKKTKKKLLSYANFIRIYGVS